MSSSSIRGFEVCPRGHIARRSNKNTGLTILSPELSAKRLEVLRDIIPGLSRVTALWDPTTGASQVTMTASAALSLNLKLQVLEVRRREDVAGVVPERAPARLRHAGARAGAQNP
jgi:hypothetical protein